ncbi:MAG: hypothetical protein AB7N76_32790 [Planctomycetota bacterium]
MSKLYEIRIKGAALDNLKAAREDLRRLIGSSQVGQKLETLTPAETSQLANTLLTLLDAVDSIVSRAKPAE